MLANGLVEGGIYRELLQTVLGDYKYQAKHEGARHIKYNVGGYGGGSATKRDPPLRRIQSK